MATTRKKGRPIKAPGAARPDRAARTLAKLEREAQADKAYADFVIQRESRVQLRLDMAKIFKYQPVTQQQRYNRLLCMEREIEVLTRSYKELRKEYDEEERATNPA